MGETIALEADHRRHAEVELAIRDLKERVGLNHMPLGSLAANAAWLVLASMAHNLARWTARLGGISERVVTTTTLRRRYLAVPGHLTRSGRRPTLHLVTSWPWRELFLVALRRIRGLDICLT